MWWRIFSLTFSQSRKLNSHGEKRFARSEHRRAAREFFTILANHRKSSISIKRARTFDFFFENWVKWWAPFQQKTSRTLRDAFMAKITFEFLFEKISDRGVRWFAIELFYIQTTKLKKINKNKEWTLIYVEFDINLSKIKFFFLINTRVFK